MALTAPVRRGRARGLRSRGACLVALAAVALGGCGGRGTRPVEGVVTLEGEPVAGATVIFMPDGQDAGRQASGFTSPDGVFRLTTFNPDDGALPGTYRVLVQKTEAAKSRAEGEQSALQRATAKFGEKSARRGKKPILPPAYAKFETTPLRCTVPVSGVVTLALNKDGKP